MAPHVPASWAVALRSLARNMSPPSAGPPPPPRTEPKSAALPDPARNPAQLLPAGLPRGAQRVRDMQQLLHGWAARLRRLRWGSRCGQSDRVSKNTKTFAIWRSRCGRGVQWGPPGRERWRWPGRGDGGALPAGCGCRWSGGPPPALTAGPARSSPPDAPTTQGPAQGGIKWIKQRFGGLRKRWAWPAVPQGDLLPSGAAGPPSRPRGVPATGRPPKQSC